MLRNLDNVTAPAYGARIITARRMHISGWYSFGSAFEKIYKNELSLRPVSLTWRSSTLAAFSISPFLSALMIVR